jgi:hypothetical protein
MIGRHRADGRWPKGWLLAVVGVVPLVAALGWVVVGTTSGGSCDKPGSLTVAVAPELLEAVRQTVADNRPTRDLCVAVQVTAAEPADVATAVTATRGASVSDADQSGSRTAIPDVWIADSTTWPQRLRTYGVNIDDKAPSVARSPVVLATPEPLAQSLGWPAAKVSWDQVLATTTKTSQLHIGTVEPTRDAAALSALVTLYSAAGGSGSDAPQAAAAVAQSLAKGKLSSRRDLAAKLPTDSDPSKLAAAAPNAAALPEHAVIAYNAARPPVRLAAIYPEPAPAALDYPFVVLSADQAKSAAANALKKSLAGPKWYDRLAAHGLRAPDGHATAGFQSPRGAPRVADDSPHSPDTATPAQVLSTWTTLTESGRTLLIIDMSGSMQTKVPTAGNATREKVAVGAAQRAVRYFDDSWQVGLWEFSTLLDGANDYKQLRPIARLAAQRDDLNAALSTIAPKPNGQTGLYDTVLAGYTAVLAGWAPDRVNSVIVMTDGKNEDPQGISLDQLVDSLHRTADPSKPIQTIMIGIGPEVNKAELDKIVSATGGGAFVATDPAQTPEIFLQAIALRVPR